MLLYTPHILALLLGLALGSFANVLIARVPEGRSILRPPSSCPKCEARIRPWDNIPVLSWLLLGRKCRDCRTLISARYPLVELLVAALFVALSLAWPLQPAFFHFLAPALLLPVLSLIDLDCFRLPNPLTGALFVCGLATTLVIHFLAPGSDGVLHPLAALLGAFAGFFSLWLIRQLSRLFLGGRSGLGLGDVKLMAGVGLYLGWDRTLLAILLACGIGLLAAIPLRGRSEAKEIPFGPWLAIGSALSLVVGEGMIAWYVQFAIGE